MISCCHIGESGCAESVLKLPRSLRHLLPVQLQRKLNLTGCPLKEQRGACAGNRSDCRVTDLRVGVVELGCVQDVEGLCPKLEAVACALIERYVLKQRQVELSGARSKKNVSPRVPEHIVPWRDKTGGVEPRLDRAISKAPRADAIGPLSGITGIQQAT